VEKFADDVRDVALLVRARRLLFRQAIPTVGLAAFGIKGALPYLALDISSHPLGFP
jgi:hypothetical protein